MLHKTIARYALIPAAAALIITQAAPAFAWEGGSPRPPAPRSPAPDHGRPHQYSCRPAYTAHYMPGGHYRDNLPHGFVRLLVDSLEYFYWEGMFYRRMADRYVVVTAPVGAVVNTLPQVSQPVIVDGVAYYNINGVTYMQVPGGFKVVPQPKTIVVTNYVPANTSTAPAVTTPLPTQSSGGAFVVNVPNSSGGYTAVMIKQSGTGYTGPQGEYYTEFPKVEQLKAMYAK